MGGFAAAVIVAGGLLLVAPDVVGLPLIGVPVVVSCVLGRPLVSAALSALALGVGVLVVAARPGSFPDWRTVGGLEIVIASMVGVTLAFAVRRWMSRMRAEEERYRILAENASDVVLATSMDGTITWASPSIGPVLGLSPEGIVGSDATELVDPDDVPVVIQTARTIEASGSASVLLRFRTAEGGVRWMEATPRPVLAGGEAAGFVVGLRDAHEEVTARQELEHERDFDSLTGLARRSLALRRVDEILAGDGAEGWALLCVGVAGMKEVNHAFTYRAGDEVLRTVADRLVRAAGAHDRVARVAGDEFVVLDRGVQSAAEAADGAERLIEACGGPMSIGDVDIDVSVCVGIAMPGTDGSEELLRDATAAMRTASDRGPGQWGFSDRTVAERSREALVLRNALRDAIAEGQVVPWFMPIVDLRTATVSGYEALARWMPPDGSIVMPGEFLPVAERSGLMAVLDRLLFTQVVEVAARGPGHLQYGFNVSAASLAFDGFASWALAEVIRAGVAPGRLHFEVTETTLLHISDSVMRTMHEIADAGISWWVDDFGTGFSSISHLRDLPIAGIKLDRSFTANLTFEETRATRLASGLAGLAEGLDLETVAEGVETIEQAQVLTSQGWHYGQGWLFGRAEPSPH